MEEKELEQISDQAEKNESGVFAGLWFAVQKFLSRREILKKEEKILEGELEELTSEIKKAKLKKYIDKLNI